MTATAAPTVREIILACSPTGIAVLHVYGPAAALIETLTGSADEMRSYAADRHPTIAIKEITK